MRLYFLRHGLADRSAWHGPDDLRPLTPRGVQRMQAEARTLAALGIAPTAVLTSPLQRALQSAQITARSLGIVAQTDPRLAPGFDLVALYAILRQYAGADSLMLVGHEPDFSLTIGALIGGGSVVCKKGTLARVDLHTLDPPRGTLVWLLPPKVLAR